MKKQVTVHKPRLQREQQAIVLVSVPTRRASLFSSDVTMVRPGASRARVCDACHAPIDADACFCGMCGKQLFCRSR